jgi:hypothetical protein
MSSQGFFERFRTQLLCPAIQVDSAEGVKFAPSDHWNATGQEELDALFQGASAALENDARRPFGSTDLRR